MPELRIGSSICCSKCTIIWPTVDKSTVDVWTELCGSLVLRRQVALMGCDAVTVEEWYEKYGHDTYLICEEMFMFR